MVEHALAGEPRGQRTQSVAGIARDREIEAGDRGDGTDHAATVHNRIDAGPGADHPQGRKLRHDVLGEAEIADHAGEPGHRDLARSPELGRPAAANHRLAAAELLDGDRTIGMLNEVGYEGGGAFGDIHVERIGGCRQVKTELRRQRLAAIAGGKHHLARLQGAFGGGDAEPGSFPCEREHRLLSEAQGTPGAGPAPNGRVGEEGIDLALMRAELRPDHRRAEIGRDPIELGAAEDRDIEPERGFALRLPRQKIELALVLGDHQAAGDLHLAIDTELALKLLPVGGGELVEKQHAFKAWNEMGIALEKDALHLDVQAAGIGGGAAGIAGIDDHNLGARRRQETAKARPDNAAANDGDGNLAQPVRRRRHAVGQRAISAIATGFTGMRGAKRMLSSRAVPCDCATRSDRIMPQ